MIDKKEDYNNVPIEYCDKCLDLKIKTLENTNIAYCGKCGNSTIRSTHIENWKVIYFNMYGKDYVARNRKLEDKK